MSDSVNHPSHYKIGKIEVIEAIEDWNLGMHLGNAVKYIARAGKKDPLKVDEDLEKAIWYLKRYIEISGLRQYAPFIGRILEENANHALGNNTNANPR